MVDFIENHPSIEKRIPKYSLYFPLFTNIKDHSLIRPYTPYGYSKDVEEQIDTSLLKENFRYHYSLDGEDILVMSNVFVTIMPEDSPDETFDLFNNPNVVRIGTAPATALGYDYPKKSDGSPNNEKMPYFYVVEILLDSMPPDNMAFLIEVIGDDGDVVVTGGDVVKIIDPDF